MTVALLTEVIRSSILALAFFCVLFGLINVAMMVRYLVTLTYSQFFAELDDDDRGKLHATMARFVLLAAIGVFLMGLTIKWPS